MPRLRLSRLAVLVCVPKWIFIFSLIAAFASSLYLVHFFISLLQPSPSASANAWALLELRGDFSTQHHQPVSSRPERGLLRSLTSLPPRHQNFVLYHHYDHHRRLLTLCRVKRYFLIQPLDCLKAIAVRPNRAPYLLFQQNWNHRNHEEAIVQIMNSHGIWFLYRSQSETQSLVFSSLGRNFPLSRLKYNTSHPRPWRMALSFFFCLMISDLSVSLVIFSTCFLMANWYSTCAKLFIMASAYSFSYFLSLACTSLCTYIFFSSSFACYTWACD